MPSRTNPFFSKTRLLLEFAPAKLAYSLLSLYFDLPNSTIFETANEATPFS